MKAKDNRLFRARKAGLSLQLLLTLAAIALNSLELLGIADLGETGALARRLLRLALPWAAPALLPIQLLIHHNLTNGSHNMPWLARIWQLLLGLALLGLWWWLGQVRLDLSGAEEWLLAGVYDPVLRSAPAIALYDGIQRLQNVLCDMLLKRRAG